MPARLQARPGSAAAVAENNAELRPAMALYGSYRQLIRAQVPADLARVVAEVPSECDSRQCAELQRVILFTAWEGNEQARELLELDLDDDNARARLNALFGQLRETR